MDAEPTTFEYAVVETCPSEADAKPRFPASVGRTRVVVWFDGTNFGGKVSFHDPAWTPLERTLRGPSCAVVLEALALAMGVAIDEAKPKPVVPSYVVEPNEEPPPVPPTPAPRRASFLRGVDLGVSTWIGSQPPPAVAVSLAIVVGSTRETTVWAPRLRVGYVASFPSSAHNDTVSSAFYTFMTRLDGCPIEIGPGRVRFSPCLRQDLGVLVGTAPEGGRRVNDFVAGTGVVLLGQLWFDREERFYLQADAAGLVSWRPRQYTGPDGSDLFRVTPVIGQFGLSIGVSTK